MKNKDDVYEDGTMKKNKNKVGVKRESFSAGDGDFFTSQRKESRGSASGPGEGPNPTPPQNEAD